MQKNKFSFAEMTSNETGKTSASGSCGVIAILSGIVGFFAGIVFAACEINGSSEVLIQSLGMITLGTSLLGLRKYKSSQNSHHPITNHQSPITNPQSPITNHQSPITNPQSQITNHQSPIPNPQSPIPNPQSPITNPQSPITNHQSPITNPHSPQTRTIFLDRGWSIIFGCR